MGSFMDKLTKPGVEMPGGSQHYYDSPQAQAIAFAKASRPDTSVADVSGGIPEKTAYPSTDYTPGPMPSPTGIAYADEPTNSQTSFSSQDSAQPKMFKPSFRQATMDQNDLPEAVTPGTTKLGKFFQILGAAAKGGMAGQAAAEQSVIASGGHRSGGVGTGFEAGIQEPYREAAMQMGAEREGIGNQIARAQVGLLPFKRLQAQAELGKTVAEANKDRYVTPRNGGVYDTSTGQYAPGSEPQDKLPDLQKLYAVAVQNALQANRNPDDDPAVQHYADAITAIQKQPAAKENKDDKAIAIKQKMALGQPVTPDEKAYLSAYDNWVNQTKVQPGVQRAMVYINGRLLPLEDPTTGALGYRSPAEIKADNAKSDAGIGPPVYAKGTNFQKNAFQPKARFDDVARVVGNMDQTLGALDQGVSQRGLIAKALQDPSAQAPGALSAIMRSEFYKQMNPTSRNYVNNVLSLREQIMGMNAMLTGSAGTSDSRIKAIWDTLPNGSEPDSDNARRKMDLIKGMIENLKEAFPLVKTVTKAQAPQNQNKSNDYGVGFVPLGR